MRKYIINEDNLLNLLIDHEKYMMFEKNRKIDKLSYFKDRDQSVADSLGLDKEVVQANELTFRDVALERLKAYGLYHEQSRT